MGSGRADPAKPAILEENSFYYLVRDEKIPFEPKQNIVLKPLALEMMARHYRAKHNIHIVVCDVFLKMNRLTEAVFHYVGDFKARNPNVHQAGFIFISADDPDDIFGHALPMVWERDGDAIEHLFFLDTMQELGQTEPARMKPGLREFQMALQLHFQLWSVFGARQIDYSSCFTDALVVLKDALKSASFKALVTPKIKSCELGVTSFYLPEVLLKTAQIASLPLRSLADFNQKVRLDMSLSEFRKAYDVPVMVNGQSKLFGAFTLFKAEKFAVNVGRMALANNMVESVFDRALEL